MRKNMLGIVFILGLGISIITIGDVVDGFLETEMLEGMVHYYQSLYQYELAEAYSQAAYFFDLVRYLIMPVCLALFLFLLIEQQKIYHLKKSKSNLDERISYTNGLIVVSIGLLLGIFYIFSMIFITQQFIPHVYFKIFILMVTLIILLLVVMYGGMFTQILNKCEIWQNENTDHKFNNPFPFGNVSKIIVIILLLLNTGLGLILVNRYIDYRLYDLPDQIELSKDVSYQTDETACFPDTLLVLHCTDYFTDIFNHYTIDTITYDIKNEYAKSILKEGDFSVNITIDGVNYPIKNTDITINEGVDFELVINFSHYISNDMKEHGFNRLNIKWTDPNAELKLGEFQQVFLENYHIKLMKINNQK